MRVWLSALAGAAFACRGSGSSPGALGATPQNGQECGPLAVRAGVDVEGSRADWFGWSDAACLPRTASLIRNDATDAFGEEGGYLRAMSYVAAGRARQIKGTGAAGWQGFGYIVNHDSSVSSTRGLRGATRTVVAGRHHAFHEFTWRVSPGGPVQVTARWMFATGRSNPLFAITYDCSGDPPDAIKADTRAPYGDLAWDDGRIGEVSGVGWGDNFKFTTTGPGPVTPKSEWDYTRPNIVPYVIEWSASADAEMGLVATLPWAVQIAGGDYGGGQLMAHWGKTGHALLDPEAGIPDWEWPYQLNQYELPQGTRSHRLAWGMNYGSVGMANYRAFGQKRSGYPYQSYSVYVVLGTHSASAVAAQVAEMEAVQRVALTASEGAVAASGPAGIGRTDRMTFTPPGWDPVYGAFALDAASNAVSVTVRAGPSSIAHPVFELRGYTATTPPQTVLARGRRLTADRDYFASVDATSQTLWLTLNAPLEGTEVLTVR